MGVGEYVAVFVSIILGIALGDLALSTHRLLRARHRVEWHWTSPLLAAFMLLNIIAFWWASFNWYREVETFSIAEFLPDVAVYFLLFLAVAAVLPDEIPEGGVSLKEFYFRDSNYFWSLNILTVILIIVHIDPRYEPMGSWQAFVADEAVNIVSVVAMIGLLLTKRAWYHYFVISMFAVLIGGDYLLSTIRS